MILNYVFGITWKGFGGIENEAPPVTREEVRQMLADNVPYFKETFLEVDITPDTEVTDIRRRGFGSLVHMDQKGRIRPIRGNIRTHVDEILRTVESNYHQGLIEAEDLAEFAIGELMDRKSNGWH